MRPDGSLIKNAGGMHGGGVRQCFYTSSVLIVVTVIWCACGYGAQAASKKEPHREYVVGGFDGRAHLRGRARQLLEREASQERNRFMSLAEKNWCPIATFLVVAVLVLVWFVKRNWGQWFPPSPPPEPWLRVEDPARRSPVFEQPAARGPVELTSPFERCTRTPASMTTSVPTISRTLRATRSCTCRKLIDCGRFGCVEKGEFVDAAGEKHSVAVKTVKAGQDQDASLATFTAEIQCFERIPPHPNVIRCFGGRLGGTACPDGCIDEIFIVEELMDMNLRDVITGKRTPWETWTYKTVLHIFRNIAQGLEHLHAHKVSHYDLKPENVLVRVVDEVFPLQIKLADFGCSQIKQRTYATAKYAGTKHYMAPEIAWCPYYCLTASGKIDVYSLGAIMWEILTGGNLTSGESPTLGGVRPLSMQAILDCPCDRRWPLADHHPVELSKLIWSCLELESSGRPTAKMVTEILHDMMACAWIDNGIVRERAFLPE